MGTIATLVSNREFCSRAFALGHNTSRYKAPHTSCKRPNHRLLLTFDNPPIGRDGFIFGSDPKVCDVCLVDPSDKDPLHRIWAQVIKRRHFAITFNNWGCAIVRDISGSMGIFVSYDGQADKESRQNFTWILFRDVRNIEVTIPDTEIVISIELGNFHEFDKRHIERVKRMFNIEQTAILPHPNAFPSQSPIYIESKKAIGQGNFGIVHKFVNVSTGKVYAAKKFFHELGTAEAEMRIVQQITHASPTLHRSVTCVPWLTTRQEHIVRFVDRRDSPQLCLIMEYAPLGHLREQHKQFPLSPREIWTMLRQCLQALVHLDALGLTHRDIKPENILVFRRASPGSVLGNLGFDQELLHVKLADFGLAKYNGPGGSDLNTMCGTRYYAAPEIFWGGSPYTRTVDVWSLAVVAMELKYGFPDVKGCMTGNDWANRIIATVSARSSEELGQLLSIMLRYEAQERRTPGEYLSVVEGKIRATWGEAALAPPNPTQAPLTNGTLTIFPEQLVTTLQVPEGLVHDPEHQSLRRSPRLNPRQNNESAATPPPPPSPPGVYDATTRDQAAGGTSSPALSIRIRRPQRRQYRT